MRSAETNPLTFQSSRTLSPFPAKRNRFLALMQTRHFGIFFTPFPVMSHFSPSYWFMELFIFWKRAILRLCLPLFHLFLLFLATSLFPCIFAYFAYFSSNISSFSLASTLTCIIKNVDGRRATYLSDGLQVIDQGSIPYCRQGLSRHRDLWSTVPLVQMLL